MVQNEKERRKKREGRKGKEEEEKRKRKKVSSFKFLFIDSISKQRITIKHFFFTDGETIHTDLTRATIREENFSYLTK